MVNAGTPPTAGPKFHVYIIESPSLNDINTGYFEGKTLSQMLEFIEVPVEYDRVEDRNSFDALVATRIKEEFERLNPGQITVFPVLHISCHGNAHGIALTDHDRGIAGNFITWQELQALLQPINESLYGQLTIAFSACEGYHSCKMAMGGNSWPFLRTIGPTNIIDDRDLLVAFTSLYRCISKGVPLKEGIHCMNQAVSLDVFRTIDANAATLNYLQAFIELPRDSFKPGTEAQTTEAARDAAYDKSLSPSDPAAGSRTTP